MTYTLLFLRYSIMAQYTHTHARTYVHTYVPTYCYRWSWFEPRSR